MYKAPFSEHFWKLRCRKSARRCGAKHISKSKCTKHHSRSTFGSCDVEKVPAVVARSTFRSQNVQSTILGALLKLRCRKSACRCGAKHISKSKCTKHHSRSTFGSCDVEKVPAVVARSTFRSQNGKSTTCSDHFDVLMAFQAWGLRRRSAKMHFAPIQETCSPEMLRGQSGDFLRGVAFWSVRSFRFSKMILRDRRSTSYDLASLFRGRRSTLNRWNGKISKGIGTRPLLCSHFFHF